MRRFSPFSALIVAALALSACQSAPSTAPPTSGGAILSPTQPMGSAVLPLANDIRVDKGVDIAFDALDVARLGVDGLLALKRVTPGSPTALRIAVGLDATKSMLNAARRAQKLGQAENYWLALDQAQLAMRDVTAALATIKGSN